MPGYFIGQYTIRDMETYKQYPPVAIPIIAQYGGKMLVVDNSAQVLEGEPHAVNVVIEFESVEAAQTWYNSAENQAIVHLRTSSTDGWAVIAKAFVRPSA